MTTTELSNVPLPAGAQVGSNWPEWGGYCRILYGQRHDIPRRSRSCDDVFVRAAVTQLPDGTLTEDVVHVDAFTLTVDAARDLAAALLAAVAEIDGWMNR